MFPIFGPFSKFSGRCGKSSHVSEQWANPMLKIYSCSFYVFSITVPFEIMNLGSLKPHNLNCCGCLLVTVCLDKICVLSSMLDHLTPPMGQVDQNATFLKTSF